MIGIYPNPSRDIIKVSGIKDWHQVEIFNISGELLHGQALGDEIDVSSLESGVYLISIHHDEGVKSFKFVLGQ